MKNLSIDIESYSSVNLAKSGVYRYAEAPDFEVLLFGYSADGAPVKVVDLTAGETLPADVRSALTDPAVTKWAFNAQFERVCLSRYLGYPTGQYLDPSSWHCTMVWAATLGLPLSLEGVGAVLGLEKQKLKEGKDLIRYFCTPAKARDGSLIRHYPTDAPEKWSLFKAYNLRDVETEMSIQQKLSKCPVTESEWRNYTLDQQINDRGIMPDRTLVTQAIRCDERFKRTHMEQARSVTGLDNPNSPVQLKAWLAEKGVEANSLSKAAVAEMLEKADGEVELALSLRQELAKSSVKKYTAMQAVVGSDDRARGLIQFYGANRTGRYAGRLIQVQNLPQNHLPDLDIARALVRSGNTDAVEMLYDSVPLVLSELIRTAFVPKPGCRFYVADFSAIEARVIAWIAGEHWRQEVFANGGDIYEYQTGADAVVLSSKYGRRETVWAKLIAGFTVTSRIYFIAVLVSLISVLAVFGVQGWNCDFQILSTTAYYGLKIWQVVFVGIVINYVVVLSVMAFTMLLSAACKTPFAAVLISTLCTIVPMFLPTSRVSGVFNKLLCLLPAKAMDTHVVFSTYVLFSFGKLVVILPCMILIAACALIIVTLPVAHRKFCRHQVA